MMGAEGTDCDKSYDGHDDPVMAVAVVGDSIVSGSKNI